MLSLSAAFAMVAFEQEKGEQACLLESVQLLDDIATHAVRMLPFFFFSTHKIAPSHASYRYLVFVMQEDIFDDRCEIFPVSIQMISTDGRLSHHATRFADEIDSIDRVRVAIVHGQGELWRSHFGILSLTFSSISL